MIDPLNQLPGQTEKVPGNRKRPSPIYIPVHCTGTFLLSKTNLLLKREVRVWAVRAVSTLRGVPAVSFRACFAWD